MIEQIKYELFEFRGIIEYKVNIVIGIEDNLIQFFDLKNNKIIKSLNYFFILILKFLFNKLNIFHYIILMRI